MRKKISLIAIGLMTFISCNKNYTCECSDTDGAKSYTFQNEKKTKAQADCDLLNIDYTLNGGSCDLK